MDTDTSVRELCDKANSIIENFTAPINEIIQLILENVAVLPGDSRVGLSMEELYAIAIRLPAECAYLQAQINSQVIEHKIRSFLTEAKVTDAIVLLQNAKGDARERQRRAEAMAKDDIAKDIVSQQIVVALQATVQRADKVYEGVKKIIDAKSKEFNYDNKPGGRIGA